MRTLAIVLLILIGAIQAPLWFGKGGWLRVQDLERQVSAHMASNDGLGIRNAAMDAEVRDLKSGYEAVEERARAELNMLKADEVYFQFVGPSKQGVELTKKADAGR